jgi:hypothetical protein
VERVASVRFDRVLREDERIELARDLRSAGITTGPWRAPAGSERTYTLLRLNSAAVPQAFQRLGARIDEPALTVLEIAPERVERLSALAEALGGTGAPAGVRDCLTLPAALLVELDESVTPLATLVDVIDIELVRTPGRRIVPILELSDERLAAFAAATLFDPGLDATRLIETYTESMHPAARG